MLVLVFSFSSDSFPATVFFPATVLFFQRQCYVFPATVLVFVQSFLNQCYFVVQFFRCSVNVLYVYLIFVY